MIELTIPEIMYNYAKARPEKVIDRPSPSQLGSCHRAHFYKIKHLPVTTPPNPGAILNFQVGFLWEEIVANALRNAKVPFLEQHPMHDEELNLSGTLDFAPYDAKTNTWEVWDSKTEGMAAHKYRKREGKTFFQNHPEYQIQLCCYAIMLERQGFNVSGGRFGIIIKDNGQIMEDKVGFTAELKAKVMARLNELNTYLSKDILPPCTCADWKVGYCDYGNPKTQKTNTTGKVVNTECCGTPGQLVEWTA